MLAFNHFSWIDPPLFGALCPRTINYVAKVEAHRVARARPADPRLRHDLGAARRVRPRRGPPDARGGARGTRARPVRRGDAAAERRPGPRAARRGDGRAPGGRPGRCRPRSTARRRGASATSTRPRSPGASRCDFAGLPAEREGLPRGLRRDRARAATALRLARPRCTRSAGPADAVPPRAMSEPARHRGDRRLPERRQVDADQPADRHPRRGRPRDARRDARPQGAGLRVERQASSCSSTRAASTSPTRRRSRARSPSRPAPAIEEADLVLFVVDARAGITPGRRGARGDPARREEAGARCSRTRSTTRAATPTRSSSTGSASATRSRSPRCTATAPATCSTRSSRGCRARAASRSARRRSASRSSGGRTSASRAC